MKKEKFYSRAFALLLTICVVFTSAAVPAFADGINGNGTEDNPYVITSAEELSQIADRINNLEDSDAYIRLDADITVDGSWTPLGKNAAYPYKGTFDGNGHSVTVTVDDPKLSYFGFFGCLENAVVKNLIVNGEIYCSEPYAFVGGIAARARGNAVIENCINNASVSVYARGSAGVGGIVGGYDDNLEYKYESVKLDIINSANNGFIMVTGEDKNVYAGGIVGSNENCVQLDRCTNTGIIYAPGVCVGGLLGQAGYRTGDYKTSIKYCSVDGTLVGLDGKVGRLYGKGVITEENIIDSGDNIYKGAADIDNDVLLETMKYPSVITISADAAAGEYIGIIKDGETANPDITLVCSQGEKDIKNGYIECDSDGIKLVNLNESGKVVRETATLQFTDFDGTTVRKPITVNIYPSSESANRTLMHKIAQTYKDKSDEWVVFDMAVYEKLGFGTNTTDKDNYRNLAVNELAGNTPLAADRAKAEIIFSALETDTTALTPYGKSETYNNAEKLQNMNLGSSYYAAPWILLAEEAGQVKLTEEQRSAMLKLLISAQGENGLFYSIWGNEKYDDADTTGTALAAVARFYDSNAEVKEFADKAIEGLSKAQGTNGSYGNINSDAMVIIGLAAMGVSPSADSRFIKDGASLADAVMLYVNDNGDGFTTSYISGSAGEKARALATEQGFRALLVLEQLKKCTSFNVYSLDSKGGISAPIKKNPNSYIATGEGRKDETDDSDADQGGSSGTAKETITVTLEVQAADGAEWLKKSDVNAEKNATAAAVIKKGLAAAGMSADGIDSGYIKSVTKDGNTLSQFDKGANSGWMYKVNGEEPQVGISDYKMKDGDGIVLYYTADYTSEPSSKKWHGGGAGGTLSGIKSSADTKTEAKSEDGAKDAADTQNDILFDDVNENDWFYDAVKFVCGINKIMQGTDIGFEPDSNVTRAMLVTILYRIENQPATAKTSVFADVTSGEWYSDAIAWANENGIVYGVSDTEFEPETDITREQMIAVLYRYAKYKDRDMSIAQSVSLDKYEDSDTVEDYAADAMKWSVGNGIVNGKTDKTLNPHDNTVRAELAVIIMRFMNNVMK